jgi:hypothetical protein
MLAGAGKTFAQIQSERSRTAPDHSEPGQAPTKPETA